MPVLTLENDFMATSSMMNWVNHIRFNLIFHCF